MLGPYRGILLDLDGVLFRGEEPVPQAAAALARIRATGVGVAFVTNNSSRTPDQVADKLTRLGFPAEASEVVTSALALGELLEVEPGRRAATAFVIGEDGVREALGAFGVRILDGDPDRADLVVVGWDRNAHYDSLKRASLLVQRGAKLVATNADASYPAPDGVWPGAGALLAAVVTTTGTVPDVAGKPGRAVFDVAARALGRGPFLVVGDRLETDVAGARGVGWDVALVLTGVTRPADLLRAPWVPDAILHDVSWLVDDPAFAEPAKPEDAPAARALLEGAGLFGGDIDERIGDLVVARTAGGEVVGVAGLEVHGADALLRSVAVDPPRRGQAIGMLLTASLVHRARAEAVARVHLLTETADGFFAALGFERGPRSEIPSAVEASPAVAGCATERSVAMRFDLR